MSIVLASSSRKLESENVHWRKEIRSGESDDQARFSQAKFLQCSHGKSSFMMPLLAPRWKIGEPFGPFLVTGLSCCAACHHRRLNLAVLEYFWGVKAIVLIADRFPIRIERRTDAGGSQ